MIRRPTSAVLILLVLLLVLACCGHHGGSVRNTPHFIEADSIVESFGDADSLQAYADSMALARNMVAEMLACQRLGKLRRNASEFNAALQAHNRCLELACQLADTIEIVRSLNHLGTNFRRLGNLEEAISYHYQALALCEHFSDKTSQLARKNRVTALNGIGNICMTLGNLETADSVLRAALQGEHELGSYLGQAINWANLGNICMQRGLTDSAWVYQRRAMEFNRLAGSEVGVGLCLRNFGELYENAGKLDSAMEQYRMADDVLRHTADTWHQLEASLSMARVALKQRQLSAASRYLVSADSAATAINSLEHRAAVCDLKYQIALQAGDTKRALEYYVEADHLRDSITTSESYTHLQSSRIDLERQRSRDKIALIDANYKSSLRQRQLLGIVLVLLLALAVGIFVLSRMRIRNQRLANQILAEQLLTLTERQRQSEQLSAVAEKREMQQVRSKAQADSDQDFLQAFAQALDNAIGRKQVDMESIASELCVTGTQLRRRIKAITGRSPLACANSLRMAKARRLLVQNPEMSIGDIAEQCGFYDVAHFSRMFRQTFNITPTQFRNSNPEA